MAFDTFSVDDVQPPATPADLVVTAGDASADVSWTAVSDAVAYAVVVDGVAQPQTSATSTTVTGLTNGDTYAITVVAVDASGNTSDPTPAQNVTPDLGDVTPPDVPTGVAAAIGPVAGNVADVVVTWPAIADGDGDLDGYRIFRDGNSRGTVAGDVLTFTDVGVPLGDHTWTVASFDAEPNESNQSSGATGRVTNAVCGDISPLACPDVRVTLPFALDFDADAGGLVDLAGVGTGFTMVQAPSARLASDNPITDPGLPGYEPGPSTTTTKPVQIAVAGGALQLTSSKGIAFSAPSGPSSSTETNSQINTLGVGIDASQKLEIRTTIDAIDFAGSSGNSSQQAGVWFGLDENNFVKLALIKQSSTQAKVQLSVEENGGQQATVELNPAAFPYAFGTATGVPIELVLTIDPSTGFVSGSYTLDGGTPTTVAGTINTVPASQIPLPASFTAATATAPFAGIFATHRRAASNAPIVASFQNFSIDEVQPPATPSDVVAVPGDATFDVSWSPVTDAVSYIVAVDGARQPAQSETTYSQPASNGTSYGITVVALDTFGNESAPSTVVNVTPDVGDINPPDVPTGVAAAVGPIAGNVADVVVTWPAIDDVDGDLAGYRVYRDGNSRGTVASDVLTFTDVGVPLGDHTWTVASFDAEPNESNQSAAAAGRVTFAVCGDISPFACNSLDVALPFSLDFDGTDSGLIDGAGVGTGFTMVDAPSSRLSPEDDPVFDVGLPGWEPSLLSVTGGDLTINSTRGISYRNNDTSDSTNSQINALGVGIAPTDANQIIEVRTTIDPIDFSTASGTSAQAGIWFGADEDNFAKLVLVRTGNTTAKAQLVVETGAGGVGQAVPIELNTGSLDFTQRIELVMTVDPVTNVVSGTYRLVAGAPVTVEQVINTVAVTELAMPAALTDDPFAGLYASSRRAATGQSIAASFSSFAVTELTPPATPAGLTATPGDTTVDVTWDSVADAVEYIVSVNGAPEPATATTSLQLTGLTNGDAYSITVVAIDAAGNASDPTPAQLVIPTDGTIVSCLPVSTLPCDQIVSALPFDLDFDGAEGGLVDSDGDDLGFTMVDTHSQARVTGDPAISNVDVRGYEPSLLDVDAGTLTIDARKGIQYLGNNTLINALGTGIDVDGRAISISTTVNPVAWPATASSQQTGLWFGLDEDNLFKLVVANAAGDTAQLQLLREVGGATDPNSTTNGIDAIVIPKTATGRPLDGDRRCRRHRLRVLLDQRWRTSEARRERRRQHRPSTRIQRRQAAVGRCDDRLVRRRVRHEPQRHQHARHRPRLRRLLHSRSRPRTHRSAGLGRPDRTGRRVGQHRDRGRRDLRHADERHRHRRCTLAHGDAECRHTGHTRSGRQRERLGDRHVHGNDLDRCRRLPHPGGARLVRGHPGSAPRRPEGQLPGQHHHPGGRNDPRRGPVPAGYLKDFGQGYGLRTGTDQGTGLFYGWILQDDSSPLDLTANGRDRNRAAIDQRLDTFVHMQYGDITPQGTNGNLQPGRWEIAVADGLYEVELSVGDQPSGVNYDSTHAINVEGAVAIETFNSSAADEYETATVIVGVSDGRLSIDAVGGQNTKINYVHITEVPDAPHVTTMRPLNRSLGFDPTDGVSADISVPGSGVGVDPNSLDGNVKLFDVLTGSEVPSTVGTSGGNDNISLQPDSDLTPGRQYRFVVTTAVTADDAAAAPFIPYVSLFTAGEPVGPPTTGTFEPLTGVSFDRVEQLAARGDIIASMAFGPDGKLYSTSIGSGIHRFDVAADGTLSNRTKVGPAEIDGRAIIGIVFDTSLPEGELGVWITHATANIGNESQEWGSKVSYLSGPNLETIRDIFINLPRSKKDHLSNSIGYGPNGDLYFLQGSNQAAGDPDGAWGDRGEKLLTAAMLHFSPTHPLVQAAKAGGAPIDVRTDAIGGYDPYATNAPLQLYATGIRNAYDFVFHSNGHVYVPTNGTAGGGNSPGVNVSPNTGIPTSAQRLGQSPGDYTAACLTRRIDGAPYTAGDVPAITNHAVQEDHLYDVVQGKYYGHPNPERCEWVLHSGNPTAGQDPFERAGGSNYAVGVQPDPNYAGYAYNFGYNKSPNGTLEYTSNTFGGQMKGRILVVRFSNNNDIVFLQPDETTGAILGAQLQDGIQDVPNSTIGGVGNFKDPLEIIEDPSTGNLYVNQYDQGGSGQGLFLLRVPAGQEAPGIDASDDELVFSATVSAQRPTDDRTIEVTNDSPGSITLSATIAAATSNSAVTDYAVTAGNGATLASGETTTVTVRFDPTQAGNRNAVLRLTDGDAAVDVGLFGIAASAYEGGNEPTLSNVLLALGHATNVGWTGLAGGVATTSRGAETYVPLFEKAGAGSVMMTPLAQYAPRETLPFGWYTGDGGAANRTVVGSFSTDGYQTILPPLESGGTSFDPGSQSFGLFYESNFFDRIGYTEDAKNGANIRRARIYPAKNRSGATIANAYIVAFEDADNGDYQDYVFLVRNVKPAGSGPVEPPTSDDTIRVNFQSADAAVPAGYLRDFGQPYGTRTLANQGTGLSYGWLDQTTKAPIDLSVGGTGPGNGRDRDLAADQRYDTLINLQSADQAGTVNGTSARALWEIAVPNGDYEVTVAVGDPGVYSDPEFHSANIEGTPAITRFAPTGLAGASTRHSTQTVQVEVTDGRLTVDAIGGQNSKFDFVEITPVNTGAVQINFQTTGAATPAGWAPDTGDAFTTARGYGWLVGGTPTDRSSAARARTLPAGDPLRQTFNIIQNDVVGTLTDGTWEYALPNGEYAVEVSVGDAGFTDSVHSVSVEGVNIISQFLPSTGNLFQSAGGIVSVTDNRLTMTSGFNGSNTKVNWIKITAAGNDETPPTVAFDVQGVDAGGGAFANRATVGITATDLGSGVEFLTYRVNSGPEQNYVGPISLQGVGEYIVEAIAVDNAGNTTTDEVSVSIVFQEESQAEISLVNQSITRRNGAPIPGFYDDWLVMSRLNSGTSSIPDFTHSFTDSATLTIQNTGIVDDLTVSALTISNPDFAIIDPPALPFSIAPGSSRDIVVRLVDTTGSNGTRQGSLTIVSDDADEPNTVVQLRGLWQVAPEGGNEPLFRNVIAAFGWTTNTGTGTLSSDIDAPASGEEVISARWKRADTTKPLDRPAVGCLPRLPRTSADPSRAAPSSDTVSTTASRRSRSMSTTRSPKRRRARHHSSTWSSADCPRSVPTVSSASDSSPYEIATVSWSRTAGS